MKASFPLLCSLALLAGSGYPSQGLLAQRQPPGSNPEGPRWQPPVTSGFPTDVGGQTSKSTTLAYERAFVSLRERTEKVAKAAGPDEPEVSQLLSGIHTNVVFLHDRWKQWSKANPATWSSNPAGDEYLRSLTRDYDLLRQAEKELSRLLKLKKTGGTSRSGARVLYASARLSGTGQEFRVAAEPRREEGGSTREARAKVLELLGTVSSDLQVKADHCRHTASGLGRTIEIVVRTKRGGEELPGYEVWFVQNGFFGTKSAYDRFRKQSSPTDSRGLPPGGYTFWPQKGKTAFDPTPVRLGGRGEETVEVDLEVP